MQFVCSKKLRVACIIEYFLLNDEVSGRTASTVSNSVLLLWWSNCSAARKLKRTDLPYFIFLRQSGKLDSEVPVTRIQVFLTQPVIGS